MFTFSPSAIPSGHWELLDLQDNPEHVLFDSIATEFNHTSGFDVYYYKLLSVDESDPLYGENQNAEYTGPLKTKIIYEPTEEDFVNDMFGITSDDIIKYMFITKTMFKMDISNENPKPGDCIKTLWNNKTYEITEIGSEQKIFQGKKLVWELICKPYRHSEESESAEDLLFDLPTDDDFPDINETTTSDELSAYGDNDYIEKESYDDPDKDIFGY